jgi:coniferyl-aldehyde dehydrogenase
MDTSLTAAAPTEPRTAPPADASDLQTIFRRLKDGANRRGSPSYEERIAWLDKLEDAVLGRREAIAGAISADFGNRAKQESLAVEIFAIKNAVRYARAHLRDWMEPEERETSWTSLPSTSQIVVQPLGLVGIISPWNYPLLLALSPLVAALAAGNGAMLKPSEVAPQTSELMRDIVSQIFAPDHVAVVTGDASVGQAFAALPFDHLIFTGSTRVGKLVMRAASENLVPVTLELGGKSPTIVGPDFNARSAAARVMAGKLLNAGQTCIAPDYVLVPKSAKDAFVAACAPAVAKLYPSLEKNADYTAIVTGTHWERLRGLVDDAKAKGAQTVEINPAAETPSRETHKFFPTLVVDPTDDMLCMKEEIFGPVLPVLAYDRVEDAIAYVNARPRPLALYYFGYEPAIAEQVLSQTVSGGVTVNETMLHFMQEALPFGGVGPSGMGQYHGREGFFSLSQKKPIYRQSRINTASLVRPPYGKLTDRLLRLLLGS